MPQNDSPSNLGDPIPELFPPDDPTARFVISMAMARNDIERALRDVAEAVKNERPDFSYRVRLSVGHLFEALDALNDYRQTFEEVNALIGRIPTSAQAYLKVASGSLQRAGPNVLKHARDNTFHYPSPGRGYEPSSDEQLREAIAALNGRGAEIHLDGDTSAITLTFADDIALAMALGQATETEEQLKRAAEIARDGAINFTLWVVALVATYRDHNEQYFGRPVARAKARQETRPSP
jgi:hypothetical protein